MRITLERSRPRASPTYSRSVISSSGSRTLTWRPIDGRPGERRRSPDDPWSCCLRLATSSFTWTVVGGRLFDGGYSVTPQKLADRAQGRPPPGLTARTRLAYCKERPAGGVSPRLEQCPN